MTDGHGAEAPTSHRVIAAAGLLWNLLGLVAYVMTVGATPEQLAERYLPAEVEFIEAIPAWATSANALGVTAGTLGCLMLLLRRGAAVPLFGLSLVGVVVQDVHAFGLEDVTGVFGTGPMILHGLVLVIAVLLLLHARKARAQGLLR